MIKAMSFSHIGKREEYEDNLYLNGKIIDSNTQKNMKDLGILEFEIHSKDKISIFAVSDGMGGHNAGEVASYMCVEGIKKIDEFVKKSDSLSEAIDIIQDGIVQINAAIYAKSQKYNELSGMGATLVILIKYDKEFAVLNIGDSRAYLLNEYSFTQITKDHTEGQRMLDLGILSRKELENFSARKNLNRYFGYAANGYTLKADVYKVKMDNGILILCSDGISDFVPKLKIEETLKSFETIEEIGENLIKLAVSNDNADNATLLLMKMKR